MGRHRMAEEKVRLGEQARAMRAAGSSRREIQAALGIGDDLARDFLRGTGLPESLRRPRAKDDVREKARRLREAGWTYPQIAEELGVSKSTCSLWLRDMQHPLQGLEGQARRTAAIRASAAKTQELREADRVAFKAAVADALGPVSDRDVLVALAVSYWCAEQLDWREDGFMRSTIKRHNPKTVRKNVGDNYHGCLAVTVRQSRLLYQVLDGLVHGIARGAGAATIGGSMEHADEAM